MDTPPDTVDFHDWLIEGGYKPRSASSYTGAINNKLSDFAIARQISDRPLVDYRSLPELRGVTNQIREHHEFQEFNRIGKSMYSAAFKLYDIYINEKTQHAMERMRRDRLRPTFIARCFSHQAMEESN